MMCSGWNGAEMKDLVEQVRNLNKSRIDTPLLAIAGLGFAFFSPFVFLR